MGLTVGHGPNWPLSDQRRLDVRLRATPYSVLDTVSSSKSAFRNRRAEIVSMSYLMRRCLTIRGTCRP
jgi:hypothetical protein